MGNENMEKEIRRTSIMGEINALVSKLDAPASDIGDWKVVKIYEARLAGKEDPYDYAELATKRQAVRDKINELQAELEAE